MERQSIECYKDLLVWQQGMLLAKSCYLLTKDFPKHELYGLTIQIRRASSSVPANIAEGTGRGSRKEYLQFLRIARGSLYELETHLLLSVEVDLTASDTLTPILKQIDSVSYLLGRLVEALEKTASQPRQNPQQP